ncbi:PAS domain S-box protein [Xanthomonas sp. AM6]|uniref:sensor histidine kinase n=1 Tax=Xanthomonas sp. AM6 TaxID=2982531 RepID=UPI0021DAD0F1|nr:PAS domain S-box protein [Xanthomonas sp. AM6]UYB53683.1 PAS domain S-box protein [Xanthomonas sp. AM6]
MSVTVEPMVDTPDELYRPNSLQALAEADQGVLDAIPAGIYVCAVDGTILRYNRHAARLWGRAPRLGDRHERYCGAHRLFLANGEWLPHERTPMATALLTGESCHGREVVVAHEDGSRRTVMVDIEALRDSHGRITGAVNCFRDVTEHKRAEEKNRQYQRDLEDFFENCAVGLHLVAGDGTIVRANQAELDLLGYPAEEYVGRSIRDFHVDADVIEQILRDLLAGQKIDKRSARLRARDGSIRHVQITSNARYANGAFVNTRCFTVDVTEQHLANEALREREHQLRQILNALPAAIYMTDAQGKITFFNEAAIDFSGRRPVLGSDEWCVTWRLYEADGTPLPHDQCPMAVALREQREIRGVEAIAERPDGTRVPFMPFPTPLRDEDGTVIGAVNMLVDITTRKRAEEEQQALIHELNHRVKNSLASVQSIAFQTFRASPEPSEFLDKFQGRLLALSKAHDLLTRRSWTGLGIDELLETELEPYALAGRERIRRNGPEAVLSPRIALALCMVLHELATNAAKYGALSCESGQVELQWTVDAGAFALSWHETGGPVVAAPATRGFGTRFIDRCIASELGGNVEFAFAPGGMRCRMRFPLN